MVNFTGFIPFIYSLSSLSVFSINLSIFVCTAYITLSLFSQQTNFFINMVPKNCPIILSFLFIVLETLAHFIKMVSLSVRLLANITSGHLLMMIFIGFWISSGLLINTSMLFLVLPIIILILILEIGIIFVQSLIFCILSVIYSSEVVNFHYATNK